MGTSNAFLLLFLFSSTLVGAQNCGCPSNLCCSKYGYCGSGPPYCGAGCQQGPCDGRRSGSGGQSSGVRVADVVSQGFFDGIIRQAGGGCEGKNFYSRGTFLEALRTYPGFGTTGSAWTAKREIAAFFAHVTHETGSFCYIREIDGASRNYCDGQNSQYPCAPGQGYYGRGPLQISWNYNYGSAGQAIGFDGLRSPDTVARDPVIAFKTALWFWMKNVHSNIVNNQGFGASIRAINGALECNGRNGDAANARVRYFRNYCQQLGVSPGNNLYC